MHIPCENMQLLLNFLPLYTTVDKHARYFVMNLISALCYCFFFNLKMKKIHDMMIKHNNIYLFYFCSSNYNEIYVHRKKL